MSAAIGSINRSIIPSPNLTAATVPLAATSGDFPEAFSNALKDISEAVVELAAQIARGQDKPKTLEIMKKTDTAADKLIEALTKWHDDQKVNLKVLEGKIANLKAENPTLGTSSSPAQPIDSSIDIFEDTIKKLKEIKDNLDKMIAKVTNTSGDIDINIINQLMQALDDGLKNLNTYFTDQIKKLDDEIKWLQSKVDSLNKKLEENDFLKLKDLILEKTVNEVVQSILTNADDLVTKALKEAYHFNLLEKVIEIVKGLKAKDQKKYELCKKIISDIPSSANIAPEESNKYFTNDGDKRKPDVFPCSRST